MKVYAVQENDDTRNIRALFRTLEEATAYYLDHASDMSVVTYSLREYDKRASIVADGVGHTEPNTPLGRFWQRHFHNSSLGLATPWWLSRGGVSHLWCESCGEAINIYVVSECSECKAIFCLHCRYTDTEHWLNPITECKGTLRDKYKE